jgi:formate-dependent nitrite reductase cytochrome c552 subunit
VRDWFVIANGVAFGMVLGIGGYTFVYARGGSYLTNDPQACANCHVMREQFEDWQWSSHRAVTTSRRLDFIEAENAMGFHAPQEAMRVLALSIENSRQGQVALK